MAHYEKGFYHVFELGQCWASMPVGFYAKLSVHFEAIKKKPKYVFAVLSYLCEMTQRTNAYNTTKDIVGIEVSVRSLANEMGASTHMAISRALNWLGNERYVFLDKGNSSTKKTEVKINIDKIKEIVSTYNYANQTRDFEKIINKKYRNKS